MLSYAGQFYANETAFSSVSLSVPCISSRLSTDMLYFTHRKSNISLPSRINIHKHGSDSITPLRICVLDFLRGEVTGV